MFSWLTMDNIDTVTHYYKELGPIVGIALTFVESYLPFLPLFVIVVANASAYGLVWGFIISWLATVLGSYTLFLIVRKFGRSKYFHFVTQRKQVQKLIQWVDMRGFTALFVLLCFPFTPIILVNIVAGLSNLKKKYFFMTLLFAKPVMIFSLSYLGSDLRSVLTSPVKMILATLFFVAVWGIGKIVEIHLNNKVERDLREIRQQKRTKGDLQ